MKKRAPLWIILGILMLVCVTITTVYNITNYLRIRDLLLGSGFIALGVHMLCLHQTNRTQIIMPIAFCVITTIYAYNLINSLTSIHYLRPIIALRSIMPAIAAFVAFTLCTINAFTKNAIKPVTIVFLAVLLAVRHLNFISGIWLDYTYGYSVSWYILNSMISAVYTLEYIIILVLVAATPRRRRAA